MADFSEDLFFSTITEWGAKLKPKEISALELARAFSARLEKLGPRYNALALPLSERAIKKAKELDGDMKARSFSQPVDGHSIRSERSVEPCRRTDHLGRQALCRSGFRL